jgi:hypothetical protein
VPTAGVTSGRPRIEQLEVEAHEVDDGLADRFLGACGVPPDEAEAALAALELPGAAVLRGEALLQTGNPAAARDAVAAGYRGLRVAADVTALVRTPRQLEAFARYEYRIDRYMRDHPFSALCAYDRAALGDAVIAQVACLHAESNAAVPFRLHACPPADGCAALSGELDLSADELLTATLRRADLSPTGDEVVLQAAGLRFADHRSLVRLNEYADGHGTTVVLRGANPATRRLAALLDLPLLRVEAAR